MLPPSLKRFFHILLVAIAALAPFCGLGAHDLWDPDEADHAQAARELLVDGRWARPTIAGESFAEKPPLQLWVIKCSALARGTDVDPFDARVPSAIGNILLVYITYLFGRKAGGPWTGALAALAAATTGEMLRTARWCQVDALFAGLFAAAAYFTFRLLTKPNLYHCAAAGAALGLAVLTKGPIAIALLVVTIAFDTLFTAEHRRRWLGRAGIYVTGSCILAVAVALPWYFALAADDPGGLGRSIVHENIDRFLHSQDHNNPFYYYFAGALWGSFAPVSLLLPPAICFAFHSSRDDETIWTRDRSPLRFALAGLIGGIVLLSIASSKQGKYLLPLSPFLALIVADFARNVVQFGARWHKVWFTAVLSVIALVSVIFTLFSTATTFFGPRADLAFAAIIAAVGGPKDPVVHIKTAIWALVPVGIGSFALLAVGIHSRASFRLAWFLAPLALAVGIAGAWVVPQLDPLKSPREAVEFAMQRLQIRARDPGEPRYAVYFPNRTDEKSVASWTGTSPFVYYADASHRRPLILRGADAVEEALKDPRPLVFVTRGDYLARLRGSLRDRLPVCFQKTVGSRTLVVVDTGK
ncbi:MAG: glycosyltransferase family 39 protein [Planctomycetes bacterium]|nr:glycosyltransferase family 39 protein [Planctomycetota bacterium]